MTACTWDVIEISVVWFGVFVVMAALLKWQIRETNRWRSEAFKRGWPI